jgi:hypothetical protein
LNNDQQARLNVVLSVAGDDEKMIRTGIIKAIRDITEPARRTYLWNFLHREAMERIRRARARARVHRKIAAA